MFDNVILDIAIGLIFLFLLYSLLASTINEFVALIFAYRHRMLEKGIEQMLDGKNYSYYWWEKAVNIILWIFQLRKVKKLNASLLQSNGSVIKTERRHFFRTIPINEKVREYQQELAKNGSPVDTTNAVQFHRLTLNKKASLFASNVINHPQYRRKSDDSILFKKPAYLTASAFSDILLDILSDRKSCTTSAPITMNDIKSFVSGLAENPELKSILNFYIEQANGDIQKFKLLIENWFDETMERVSGWYKRQTTKILFLIGLILAIMFNVSTIAIVRKLAINKDLRAAMVTTASNYVKQKNSVSRSKNGAGSTLNGTPMLPVVPNDSINDTSTPKNEQNPLVDTLQTPGEKIAEIQRFYADTIAPVNMLMGLGWGDYGKSENRRIKSALASKRSELKLLTNAVIKNSSRIENTKDSVFKVVLIVHNKRKDSVDLSHLNVKKAVSDVREHLDTKYQKKLQPTTLEKIGFIFKHATPVDWIGFIITALAITLGAPFWFDLLNRFVNVRAGGNNPSENVPPTTVVSKTVVTQKPDINSFG